MDTKDKVKDYYGNVLSSTKDLKTNACCTPTAPPPDQKAILDKIHPDVNAKYYGCGLISPGDVVGKTVLDLGAGSGRDVYMLSAMVGETGQVIGIDMTDEQLETARNYQDYHAHAFGHQRSNVTFKKGHIEDLQSCGIDSASIDLVISNCVINLSTDKPAVYREIMRVLKPGGEMLISDVFSDKVIPEVLRADDVLYGECLSGALSLDEFKSIMQTIGLPDYTIKTTRILSIENPALQEKTQGIVFHAQTIHAQKSGSESGSCCS